MLQRQRYIIVTAAVTQGKYPLSGQLRIRGEGAVALTVDLAALLMQGRVRTDYYLRLLVPFLVRRLLLLRPCVSLSRRHPHLLFPS